LGEVRQGKNLYRVIIRRGGLLCKPDRGQNDLEKWAEIDA